MTATATATAAATGSVRTQVVTVGTQARSVQTVILNTREEGSPYTYHTVRVTCGEALVVICTASHRPEGVLTYTPPVIQALAPGADLADLINATAANMVAVELAEYMTTRHQQPVAAPEVEAVAA